MVVIIVIVVVMVMMKGDGDSSDNGKRKIMLMVMLVMMKAGNPHTATQTTHHTTYTIMRTPLTLRFVGLIKQ
ncbi:hypothetical protein E2C01_041868 [Portunus trituberculatus]|uniref:Secreted protein n=1 Tax=Portunus trituberculatus TaxID=210409 RepID=A0A5B7FSU6_PORTR|nr:hypothetical protein [Portunus trituberculatus]